MRKKRIVAFGICLLLIVGYIAWWKIPHFYADRVEEIQIITLPSPPTQKVITEREDVEYCVDWLNQLDLRPAFNFSKGWTTMFKINEHRVVSIMGDEYVSIDMFTYKVMNSELLETVDELFEEMDYKEEKYP